MVLGSLRTLVLVALERARPVLLWEVLLILHPGIAPGDAEPAVVDGDALHLAHSHERVAAQRELDEPAGLVGPVHVVELAELQEELPELVVSHGFVDAADEQGGVVLVGGILAGLVSWQPWCHVAFRVDLTRSEGGLAVTIGAILY